MSAVNDVKREISELCKMNTVSFFQNAHKMCPKRLLSQLTSLVGDEDGPFDGD